MKAKVTLEELQQWAKVYPDMTILDFIKILTRIS